MTAPIARLAHVAINTANLDRLVDFYTHVVGLGAPTVGEAEGSAYRRVATWQTGPALRFLVFEVPGFDATAPAGGGPVGTVDHLAFVPNDPADRADTVDRLVAAGRCSGEQTLVAGWRSVRFTDPDGSASALVWPPRPTPRPKTGT